MKSHLELCGLANVVVLQFLPFLKLVAWCVARYESKRRVVLSVDHKKTIVHITREAFRKMLNFHDIKNCHPLDGEYLPIQYENISINENKNKLLLRYMMKNAKFKEDLPPYIISIFSLGTLKKGISMIC